MRSLVTILVAMAPMLAQSGAQKKMADGRVWTTANLRIATPGSYCYDDREANCAKYGRLSTWEAAKSACEALGTGWRLPSNDEWRRLVTGYGPMLGEDAAEHARVTFLALLEGGSSGFGAMLGGGRGDAAGGGYSRLDAHGFYWTSTSSTSEPGGGNTAWFYNFGRGAQAVNRHDSGEKLRAFSVRCARD